jgi:ADP-ribose pyrophosphatase YjhB (NUDIX family)
VGAAIVQDGRVLIAVRGIEPEKGKFDVPGGFLLPGEHPLDGLRREMAEELGVEIEIEFDDFVQAIPHQYGDEGDWVLSLGFAARIVGGTPRPADDVADLRWVTLEELEEIEFAWPHDRDLARVALQRSAAR